MNNKIRIYKILIDRKRINELYKKKSQKKIKEKLRILIKKNILMVGFKFRIKLQNRVIFKI